MTEKNEIEAEDSPCKKLGDREREVIFGNFKSMFYAMSCWH